MLGHCDSKSVNSTVVMLGHCDSKSVNSTVVMLGHCDSKFTCGRNSRQCYTAEQRCDGVNNCNHRTDELHCCQFIALLILRRAQWRKSVFAVTCTHTHTHTHTRLSLTALFLGLPGSAGTRKVKQSGFY